MERAAWQDTVHGITDSQGRLKQLSTAGNLYQVLDIHNPLCLRPQPQANYNFKPKGKKKVKEPF